MHAEWGDTQLVIPIQYSTVEGINMNIKYIYRQAFGFISYSNIGYIVTCVIRATGHGKIL